MRLTDLYLLSFCGLHSLSAAIFHHRIVTCAACRGQLWPPYHSVGPTECMGTVRIRSCYCLATNVFILLPTCGTSKKWIRSSVLPSEGIKISWTIEEKKLRSLKQACFEGVFDDFLGGLMSFYDRSTCNLIFFLVSK